MPVKRDAKQEIKEGCPTFRTAPFNLLYLADAVAGIVGM